MRKIGATFLTEKSIDKDKVLLTLKKSINLTQEENLILKEIISSFEENNYSLLTAQEIQFLNNHSSDQWSKYIIFRYKFKNYPKKHIDSDIPTHIIVEPISACNLRCVFCYQVDEDFSNNQNYMGSMNLELFEKIVDQVHSIGIQALTITGRGEPTLNPKIGAMLEYCKGKFFDLKMNTNATRLDEKLIHQILKSGVTDLVFSVDAYEKKEYESIRIRGIFEDVFNNIKKFKEIKDKHYPDSKCSTRISGVKINSTLDSNLFKKFWEKYVDHVVLVELQERWDTYHNPVENAGKGPCNYLWGEMNIWYDGTCNPCDVDYKSELALGNVNEQSIKEIWNGKKFQTLRNLHKNGKRSTCHPCDRCSNW
jgi:radical SAM protein with 4Fe4S-binding SPASM domain